MQNSELNLDNLLTSGISFSVKGIEGNRYNHTVYLPKNLAIDITMALRAQYSGKYEFSRIECGTDSAKVLKEIISKGDEGLFVDVFNMGDIEMLAKMNHIKLDFTTTFKRSKLTGRVMYQKVKFLGVGEYEEECEEISIPEQEKASETNQEIDM